ncbi:MAG TPA: restriction endonuclease [Rhizomicrobium sp.]|nr:restriction endonuclease [Rhizomicrobium sp.]
MYYIDLKHDGLKKFRRISGADQYVVEQRASAQREYWDEQWKRKCEQDKKHSAQQRSWNTLEGNKEAANRQTQEAEEFRSTLNSILDAGLKTSGFSVWNALYNNRSFSEPQPAKPNYLDVPREPQKADAKFEPQSDLWSSLFSWIKKERERESEERFGRYHREWEATVRGISAQNDAVGISSKRSMEQYEAKQKLFESHKAEQNAQVDKFRARYESGSSEAVTEYIDSVLTYSAYPNIFPKKWNMDFVSETGVLILDYELPPLEDFPTVKSFRYVQSRRVMEQTTLREPEIAQLYDSTIYQTCLRTLYELFQSDTANALTSIVFNGWVDFTDKATGKPARSCIMSVQTTKEKFGQINLSAVDPRACFRALKGVGSAKLAGMSPVVPILRLNKTDSRFVSAHDVIDSVTETTNIAAIPWEEFEYLVRDIFEKEFSKDGGEVKITRASRDQGVDAVAFDPDPIKGGKIVIQAKRYTNVVGVSAVRDLYGTVMNEGANRGVLVTTSQYGPDSYEFANGKPITLLDGGNLLSLLERHGHKARIDLAEAKRMGLARENYQK